MVSVIVIFIITLLR